MRLTNIIKYSLYSMHNVIRRRPITSSTYLPLYQSRVFTSNQDLQSQLSNPQVAQRYKEMLACLVLSESGIYAQKFLTVDLKFSPDSQRLKITTLRARGFLEQQFDIKHIIPWTYADMRHQCKMPEPTLPVFLDDTMLYYNKFLKEILLFEDDGKWDEKTIENEKLQLDTLLDEKEWFDRRPRY